jgi:hypothetical protein
MDIRVFAVQMNYDPTVAVRSLSMAIAKHEFVAILGPRGSNGAGFEFDTCGQNRRVPVDLDGFRLVVSGGGGPRAGSDRRPQNILDYSGRCPKE